MVTAVISKIVSMQSTFTVSENEIAQFVMKNAERVVTSSITMLAQFTNTSEASINRFCKKLGFKGFNSFKIALAQENFFNTLNAGGGDGEEAGYVAQFSRDYRQMLANTSAMLDEDAIVKAVACLGEADAIHIFAYGSASVIARELEFRLQMVGLNAKAATDTNIMRMFATGVRSGDVVVAIVPTILMRDVYQTVAVCKDKGAKIVTITSSDSPRLDDVADFKFITSDKITARHSLSLSNNLLYLFVIDVLYGALLDRDKSLRQKKRDSDAYLGMNQMMDNHFFDY